MTDAKRTRTWDKVGNLLAQSLEDMTEGIEIMTGLNEEVIREEGELQTLREKVERLDGTGEAMEQLFNDIVGLQKEALRLERRIDAMVAVTPPEEVPQHIPVMRDRFRTLGLPIDYPAFLEGVLSIAIQFILDHAHVEGENHRVWVIDQVLRILSGENYEKVVEKYEEDNEDVDWDEDWDAGVAP